MKIEFVTLTKDVMFANQLPSLFIMGKVGLLTVEFMLPHAAKQWSYNLLNVVTFYYLTGFHIQTIIVDIKLEKLMQKLPLLVINTIATRIHATKDKCHTSIMKEQCHGIISTFLFACIPNSTIIHLIHLTL